MVCSDREYNRPWGTIGRVLCYILIHLRMETKNMTWRNNGGDYFLESTYLKLRICSNEYQSE